tara:strand:+ start:1009 stop:1296 length:288 start_codon:yes stop_codon:yes gene_type:complete
MYCIGGLPISGGGIYASISLVERAILSMSGVNGNEGGASGVINILCVLYLSGVNVSGGAIPDEKFGITAGNPCGVFVKGGRLGTPIGSLIIDLAI